ncbi:MAG: bifunctional diguanylate cyclase/phosphodiesterase [Lachnospiraceae bacterium]|nr:bifunctional diguanylate cyclase/phosphodiesterase [Lachnospiraceae bacterium]
MGNNERMARVYSNNLLIVYHSAEKRFQYPENAGSLLPAVFDDRPLWQIMIEDKLVSAEKAEQFRNKLEEIAAADTPQVYFREYCLRCLNGGEHWYRIGFISPLLDGVISITITDIDEELAEIKKNTGRDDLTGLYRHNSFCEAVDELIKRQEKEILSGEYALACFDILRFKAVNDIFGTHQGDRLLKHVADMISSVLKPEDFACRSNADRFVIFTHTSGKELGVMVDRLMDKIADYDLPFEIMCNMGIYVTGDTILPAGMMIDRALLAQSTIKGSYTIRVSYYQESLRTAMLTEQDILAIAGTALEKEQFVLYYQPQYNHVDGTVIGAEALVRWKHPERGLISPGLFIPIFEKNGYISKLDFYVFEHACEFLKRCQEQGLPLIPVSTNFCRQDIFMTDFAEKLEEIRSGYGVPARYLRVEITESAIMGSNEHVNEMIKRLHLYGYIVEMDDFGSGYSSLNVLKDIEMDIIKLDMLFLSEETNNTRGGTILSSVVRMAKWLRVPVIAEGVETLKQADFLRSIGCNYIQGYLYSRPLPEEQYVELLTGSKIGSTSQQMHLIENLNSCDFWDPKSQETLIFNNYVGGAAIFDYHDGKLEILRVNKKYLREIGMNLSEKEVIESDFLASFDEENKKTYLDMLKRAIDSLQEQECDTWRDLSSACCGEDRICIRSSVQVIARSDDSYLFYAMIRNVTNEMNHYMEILDNERRFKVASEQVNIYYWEYNVATKEMRPCFRCMRDLGLPSLLTNYPDSAIERGVFPPEVADMYRDWHRQIEEGAKELEAVIPLTMNRIPFHVRYTTEFDEAGHPVKAYGSAALVVREE